MYICTPSKLLPLYSYILNSVRFQTKSSLVWKSDSKNVVTIFQTKPSLVWKLKMLSQISKPNPVWFGNFWCQICGGNKIKLFGLEILSFQINFFHQFKNKEIPSVGSGNCMVVFISDTDGQFVCEMSSAVGSMLPLFTFSPTLPRSLLFIAIFR